MEAYGRALCRSPALPVRLGSYATHCFHPYPRMTELQDLATLIRAATPLIVIETAEETRVLETFRHLIAQVLRPLYR